jgi:AcrR family transcriptional regulator
VAFRFDKRYDLLVTELTPNTIEPNTRRGRPRSDRVRQLILNTALDLAFEVGFRTLTVEMIAAKTGVGKTTIYRRWPNKGAVVMDAFLSIVGPKTIFPSTDRAINSIQLQMKAQVKAFRSKYGKMIRSLVGDGQFDPDVLDAFRQRWILPRRQLARTTIELGMKQGDLRSDLDVDTVIDTLYAPIYYRLMFETGPISDAYAKGLYQSVVKGYGTSRHPKIKR